MKTLTHSHRESRACSRCGKKLTDPVSFTRGVGPSCAMQDTVLFARTIPANYGSVTLFLMAVTEEMIPDLEATEDQPNPRAVFVKTKTSLQNKAQKAISEASMKDITAMAIRGENLKEEIRAIDWLCSFELGSNVKTNLIGVVRAAGFIALAGVLGGEASTGEAKIGFDPSSGYLTLTGSKNKSGWKKFFALKHKGVVLPLSYNDRTYKVPARLADEFALIAQEFWPMFEENLEGLVDQAKAWIAALPPAVAALPPVVSSGKPVATVMKSTNGSFTVQFPWTGNGCYNVVNALKAVNYKDRKYEPSTKVWTFNKASDFNRVSDALTNGGFTISSMNNY